MPIYLRQSTASQEVPLGYFVDSGDGNTEETGLTINNTDIKIWKAGTTTLANKNSGGATHISNGIYYCTLDDTDTNTIGPLIIFVHVSGALAIRVECVVLDETVYDVLFGTTAISTLTASAVQTEMEENGASILDTLQDRILGTLAAGTHNPQSGDAYSRLGAPAGASIAADLVVIDNFVDDLESRLTATRAGYLDNLINLDAAISSRSSHAAADIWSVGTRALTDKANFSLSSAGLSAIWDEVGAITSISFETLVERIYEMLNNKMIITESSGNVALRNLADSADVATGNVQDLGATTQRNALTWV